jgi:prepilin-type N-terminal cleavage/methylation domain-containing protein
VQGLKRHFDGGSWALARVRRRGLTLIELLMVMGLMAMMLGLGVGALTSIDLGTYGAGSMVRSTLRSTANWSRARQAPARVRIDSATGTMFAEGLTVVGTWHFEKVPLRGAFDLNGELRDAFLVDDGFVGKALSFNGAPPNASYEIPVQTDPAFALQEGFQFQFVLRAEGRSRGTLIRIGDTIKIEVNSDLGLKMSIMTQRFDPESQQLKAAGKAVLETPPGVLAVDQWRHVLLTYDRTQLAIFVEGVRVAVVAEQGSVAASKSKLVLGGGQTPWEGSIDNLVINAVGAQEEVQLPDGVQFMEGTPKQIAFGPDGGLDRSIINEPIQFEIEYADGRRDTFRVNMYGTIE